MKFLIIAYSTCVNSIILSFLNRVAPIDLPEILVEVKKGIFKSNLSKPQAEIQETRYSAG